MNRRRRPQASSLFACPKIGLLVVLLAVSRPAVATFTNDFSDYPSGTQDCLDDASDQSNCQGDTSQEMNACLCSNGGNFVTNAGTCIAQADSEDMQSTWEIMSSHCEVSNTPLSVSEDDFLALASSVSSTTQVSSTTSQSSSTSTREATTTTGTSTSTPTPDDDDDDQQGGLSTGAKIGIIAGAAVVGVILLLAAIFFFVRYRKRARQYEEVHPMQSSNLSQTHFASAGSPSILPGHANTAPSELEGTESTIGTPSFRQTWQSSWTGSQIPRSPSEPNSTKDNTKFGNPYEAQSAQVYEMPADNEVPASVSPTTIPVEMPTISVISPTVSPTSQYTGAGWEAEMPTEPKRYEPYRPR